MRKNILIAGIGGASLGTELLKCLGMEKEYNVFGADISRYAYGHYKKGFANSYVVNPDDYVSELISICKRENIRAIIPGGEQSLNLLNRDKKRFEQEGILLAVNSGAVMDLCSDKINTFSYLESQGIRVPKTKIIEKAVDLDGFCYPCVIKPSTGSGGSVFVYIAENEEEAALYSSYLNKRGLKVIAQEYIPVDEGEYSLGVLSLPNGDLVGSIALRRYFDNKLSYTVKYDDRIISSPYSQGIVEEFKEIRQQAETISRVIGSKGPLNIQGRLINGTFCPFEINARFSGGSYLRAMAGFNEVSMFLEYLLFKSRPIPGPIKPGLYLRSLEEKYVRFEEIK